MADRSPASFFSSRLQTATSSVFGMDCRARMCVVPMNPSPATATRIDTHPSKWLRRKKVRHDNSRLVPMPCRRKRAWKTERRVGVSQYPDASVRRVRNLEAGATIEEIIEQFDIARE